MKIHIDPRRNSPPSEQIAEQVRFAVAANELAPGDRLPSVRMLAVQALVNPNTIAKAWRELEREGVIESRAGDGVFVAAKAIAICRTARDESLRERLEQLVSDFRAAGLGRGELEAWIGEMYGVKRAIRSGGSR